LLDIGFDGRTSNKFFRKEGFSMSDTIESLKKQIDIQSKLLKGYEKVLQLNEKELANADEIIKMYESIMSYSSVELKNAQETVAASDIVASISREELMLALQKIKELETQNKKLREEALNLNLKG
jgi:Ser/Thr protein kinase RdoA (MazF antagonist)